MDRCRLGLGVEEGHGDDDRQCSNWQKIYEYKMNSLEEKRELKGKRGLWVGHLITEGEKKNHKSKF